MKIKILVLLCTALALQSFGQDKGRHQLWYNKPANNWNEALPIGNGFIGGMIFGGLDHERIQLNESTIWGGGPNNNIDPQAGSSIAEVRVLLAQKKYVEAQELANRKLGPKGNSGMPYQLAGNLYIDFPGHTQAQDYRRDLDIANATASTRYKLGGVTYKREYFTSFGSKVMMVRLSADRPKMISCKLRLQSPLSTGIAVKGNEIILQGKGSDHENQKGQIKFNVITRVKNSGGSQQIDTSGISIMNADTAVIYLSIATNFVNYKDISADPLLKAQQLLDKAYTRSFSQLLEAHHL
ncbi:MAG TPA: glycoside hydrolase family 95 protein, partial [Pedobacter sp.]